MRATLFQGQVLKTVWITPSVFVLRFLIEDEFRFKAGQKISVVIPPFSENGFLSRGIYPLASSPLEARVFGYEIIVQWKPGDVASNYLLQLKPRDTFFAEGPHGELPFQMQEPHQDVVLLGVGDGIATLKSFVGSEEFRRRPPQKTFFLQGVHRMQDLILPLYFRQRGIHLIGCTSREVFKGHAPSFPGRVTEYLRFAEAPWNWKNAFFYVAGKPHVVQDTVAVLKIVKRIPEARIVFESVPPISQDPERDLSLLDLGKTPERKAG